VDKAKLRQEMQPEEPKKMLFDPEQLSISELFGKQTKKPNEVLVKYVKKNAPKRKIVQ
jgi:hypothetical protein